MSPAVTFLTDFGRRDTYVAEMKGAVLMHAPTATLVDITHEVPMGDVAAGAFLVSRSWHCFPADTVHLAVVDPGVGTERRAIALRHERHHFVGPDNGLLSPVLTDSVIVEIAIPANASSTFHGRDVFAPVAGQLAAGVKLEDLGVPIRHPITLSLPQPRHTEGRTFGTVVFIDHFGNLVTNLPGTWVTPETELMVGGIAVGTVCSTFADVAPGEFVAYVGSGGTVEVGVREGSAAVRSGVRVGGEVVGITV